MKDERVSVALPVSEAPLVNEAAKARILPLREGTQRFHDPPSSVAKTYSPHLRAAN